MLNQTRFEPMSCDELDRMSFDVRRLFCHHSGRYLLVTTELVTYLKNFIGTSSALEIGAGVGDLGRALNIPMVDNFVQTWPEVAKYYAAIGQPTINYGEDVERMDANLAVSTRRPDIVIGSWMTNWINPNRPPPKSGGSIYGIKENDLLRHCRYYVHIGAEEIHKHKPIMMKPHETIDAHFVRSRRTDNKIWIWRGKKL